MPVHGATTKLRDRARANTQIPFVDNAAIYRHGALAPSGDFGANATYTLLEIVPANYWSTSGREALVLQALGVMAEVTVAMPHDVNVTEKDQIVYTVLETGLVHHFEIVFVYDRSRGHDLRVACVEYKFQNP